jgi:AMMECR1 domain-containing protein
VESERELDPRRFGVIVSAPDGRRGLLLPGIPQIRTAQEQLLHARHKAGITHDEFVRVERFEIEKFEEPEPVQPHSSLASWSPS